MQTIFNKQKTKNFTKADDVFWLTPEEAKNIKIVPAGEEEGYQRDRKPAKISEIIAILHERNYIPFPAIRVASVNGELECIDGQHRLEAHIAAKANIKVEIISMSRQEAAATFLRDNGKSTSLNRRNFKDAAVVAGCFKAKFIQEMEQKYDASNGQVMCLLEGLSGGPVELGTSFAFEPYVEKACDYILKIWANDPRWLNIGRQRKVVGGFCDTQDAYSSKNLLKCLGKKSRELIRQGRSYKEVIDLIHKADFKKKTVNSFRKLATQTGSAGTNLMYNYVKTLLGDAYQELL